MSRFPRLVMVMGVCLGLVAGLAIGIVIGGKIVEAKARQGHVGP